LPSAERERQIVEGAIEYFAAAGFAGGTRELSRQLGITQPLLYRYFSSKQALIERVYEQLFLRRLAPEWITALADRSRPLTARLIDFYRHYSEATYNSQWIRLYFHAGLAGVGLNARYIAMIERRLLPTICAALRAEFGLPPPNGTPVTARELEFVWKLHAGIFYWAVRKFVYGSSVLEDFDTFAADAVDAFVAGAERVLPRIVAGGKARRR
jgi:AcrR family transcriptional regulator